MIRKAKIEDAYSIAVVHTESWQSAYANIMPADFLANISIEERAERWRHVITHHVGHKGCAVVAVQDDKVVGAANIGLEKYRDQSSSGDEDAKVLSTTRVEGYDAEFFSFYLLESYRGRGIGKRLFQASVDWVHQQNGNSMLGWTIADNHPTRRLYEKLGARPVGEKTVEIGGKTLLIYAYGWEDLSSLGSPKELIINYDDAIE